MKSVESWFGEYGESHQNKTNKAIHWICVPAIYFSVLGMIWAIPNPTFFTNISPHLNFATLTIAFVILFYLRLSLTLALGMLVVSLPMYAIILELEATAPIPVWQISLGIFAIAWVFQFIGHKIEGKKPSFLKDMQFLLIGPIWLLGFIYKKLNIAY
ncbi:PF06127 family protein [Leptospira fainei serovar Hurstbridge str. BUT 6]|uniref:PF06127 family protein n=1 Tax=Leptospira fainei serovar Hurstbridge str. BUT 6 TaxID=1193011 RepID=S3VI43_9LEPT|nr:Mpo1-like protein [Leptospira fainei]EPG76135.1 PF06127 family protein [Leptospira fainei serovar Hurstbridge str. BUT 6]